MTTAGIWQYTLPLATTVLLLGLLSALLPVQAGVDAALGKTYSIGERDFLEVIREKLQAKQDSGEIAAMQQAMQATVRHTVENPAPVPGITRATQAATRHYDPAVIAPNGIRDAEGNEVIKAGTQVNPLDFISFSKVLLFIDGRDPQQAAYAERYYRDSHKPVKVVLVGGSYMKLMREWKRPVFYDQGGYLTRRLAITAVPALVYQDKPSDNTLRIDTIVLPQDTRGQP